MKKDENRSRGQREVGPLEDKQTDLGTFTVDEKGWRIERSIHRHRGDRGREEVGDSEVRHPGQGRWGPNQVDVHLTLAHSGARRRRGRRDTCKEGGRTRCPRSGRFRSVSRPVGVNTEKAFSHFSFLTDFPRLLLSVPDLHIRRRTGACEVRDGRGLPTPTRLSVTYRRSHGPDGSRRGPSRRPGPSHRGTGDTPYQTRTYRSRPSEEQTCLRVGLVWTHGSGLPNCFRPTLGLS